MLDGPTLQLKQSFPPCLKAEPSFAPWLLPCSAASCLVENSKICCLDVYCASCCLYESSAACSLTVATGMLSRSMRLCAESVFQNGWILAMRARASADGGSPGPACNSSIAGLESQTMASVATSSM